MKTAVGWAPVAPTGTPSAKPVMLIGAEGDTVVPPAKVRATYASFRGPKALVEISGEGHNTYTDICTGIRSGGGLISYAISAGFVSASLAKLGINGCQANNLAPERFWPIVQYYTVIQLENQLGGDSVGHHPVPRRRVSSRGSRSRSPSRDEETAMRRPSKPGSDTVDLTVVAVPATSPPWGSSTGGNDGASPVVARRRRATTRPGTPSPAWPWVSSACWHRSSLPGCSAR